MAQPRYKSEVFVPIHQDSKTFEERQRTIWEDMHERMEQRRKEWDSEVENMRKDFFRLKPQEKRRGSSENLLEKMDLRDIFHDDSNKPGDKKFRVSFDTSQFEPNEISVRTQDQKLHVHAKHEEMGTGRNVCREFSRQVDIPQHVDPQQLVCTLSNDGILQVEAPVPAPAYNRIRESAAYPSTTSQPSPQSYSYQAGPVTKEEDGSRMFKISLDIGREFRPEDLNIKTLDKKLIVHARHEEKGPGRSSCREFSREFDLPENVDPNLVTASMTDDGKLLVEAPISSYTQGSYTGRANAKKHPVVTIAFNNK